ncbi:hypothetical protein CJU90_0665 [Yarrowia sp. C11]|nr:hypothetical protein CKK34_2077 [Yarrowia sp. E02]KAG5373001.1 hypothetical protein CJU90_0665 [Yarrowia sp. C11]
MTEPLEIDISELRKYNDIDARSMLNKVARWYFYQLGELQSTKHDLQLFQQLVYRFKFVSASQERDMNLVNLEKYANRHLFEISVLLDGTETWRYVDEGTSGGIHFKDQRLVNEPVLSYYARQYPRIGDTDFEIPNQSFPYGSFAVLGLVGVLVVVFIVRKVRRGEKKRD